MPEFKVHVYAIVRVPVSVTTDTPEAAARMASDMIEADLIRDHGEYAEDVESYLVDCPGGGEVTLGRDFKPIDNAAKPAVTASELADVCEAARDWIVESFKEDEQPTSLVEALNEAIQKAGAASNGA